MLRIELDCFKLDELFPSLEDGVIDHTADRSAADAMARELLGVGPDVVLAWAVPDVFSIAYSSTFAASATAPDGRVVEFHMAE